METVFVKILSMLQRRPSINFWDFRTYLREEHNNRVLRSPGFRGISRIITNFAIELDFRPTTNAKGHIWHAVVESYFDNLTAARTAFRDMAFEAASGGDPEVVELASNTLGEEFVMYDKSHSANAIKILAFFKSTLPIEAPISREEMDARWREHGGRMSDAEYDQVMYKWVRTLADFECHSRDPQYDYDGLSSLWFPSVEAAENVLKNKDNEKIFIPSMAKMGTTNDDSVYLRVQVTEDYTRPE